MGNQLATVSPSQVQDVEEYLNELSGFTLDRTIRSTRFLKTVRARNGSHIKLVKFLVKPDSQLELQEQAVKVQAARRLLASNPNTHTYQETFETDKAAFLIRDYHFSNLYDRLNTRPFLNPTEKAWIAFQLLQALKLAHHKNVCHGDIKIENVLLTSWNWVLLSDFANFKPAFLPEDNPAAFAFFYESPERRACAIAPERIYTPAARDVNNISRQGPLTPAMDIFSVGCVIAEMFTDGTPLFDLGQLVLYRENKYQPTAVLDRIQDTEVRALVTSMISRDPKERKSAAEYLSEWKGRLFPSYFEDTLHEFMAPLSHGTPQTADQKMFAVRTAWPALEKALAKEHGHSALLVGSLVTACMRSLTVTSTKLGALDVLLKVAAKASDIDRLDRILPYIAALLSDHLPVVRAAALRSLTQCVCMVTTVRPGDLNVFPEYIFPNLASFCSDEEVVVRTAYAENIATLSSTAQLFLELATIHNTSQQSEAAMAENLSVYDNELLALREMVQADLICIMTDAESIVKQTLLASNLESLCVFLGNQKCTDVLLCHMLTLFNDKRDWRLRIAFLKSIVGVASFVGGKSLERYIFPLIEKCLMDCEEWVVAETLHTLTSLVQLRLLDRVRLDTLIKSTTSLLVHPNVWIRYAEVAFVVAVAQTLPLVDVHTMLTPRVEAYVKRRVGALDDECLLLESLQPAITRELYDYFVSSPMLEALFDLLLQRSLERKQAGGQAGSPDAANTKPGKQVTQSALLTDLKTFNLKPTEELLLLALEDYIRKASIERQLQYEDDEQGDKPTLVHVRETGTRVFEASLVPSKKDSEPKFSIYRTDLQKLIARKRAMALPHPSLSNVPPPEHNGRQGKARSKTMTVGMAREKSATPMTTECSSWRPEGVLVGHLHEHRAAVNRIAVASDHKFFATASDDGTVRVWDCHKLEGRAVANRSRQVFNQQGGRITRMVVCDQSYSIASAADNGSLHVVRVEHAMRRFTPMMQKNLDLDEDGCIVDLHHLGGHESVLAYATVRGRIHGWDLRTEREGWCLNSLPAQGLIQSFVVDEARGWMLVGTSRGVYTVWDLRYGLPVKSWVDLARAPVKRLERFPTSMLSGMKQRPGPLVMSAAGTSEVVVWDVPTGNTSHVFRSHSMLSDRSRHRIVSDTPGLSHAAIKPPRQAYDYYWNSKSTQLRQSDPTLRPRDLERRVSKMWADLPAGMRQPFLDCARQDAVRYQNQSSLYLNELPDLSDVSPDAHTCGFRAMLNPPGSDIVVLGGADRGIRVWDVRRPTLSYILGEQPPSEPTASGSGSGGGGSGSSSGAAVSSGGASSQGQGDGPSRAAASTQYGVEVVDGTQIVQERLPEDVESRGAKAQWGPVAPASGHYDCVTDFGLTLVPHPLLISGGQDGVVKIWK
eukprot:m.168711 g.168711  ORF g.168711 m.168711 type:complete len:1395 (-) comp17794_c0_seq2:240-4424(-)